MSKINKINEGWGAMIRRDLTDAIRDEERTPWIEWFKTVNWIDMGDGVMWSDSFVPMDDLYNADFTDTLKSVKFQKLLKQYGAEIPTSDDFVNLVNTCKKSAKSDIIKSNINGNELKWECHKDVDRIELVSFPLMRSHDGHRDIFRVFRYMKNLPIKDSSISLHYFTKTKYSYIKVILIKRVQD